MAQNGIKLAWDPNTESNLAGYKIYYGSAAHAYATAIDVGNTTSYTLTASQPGTYYIAVTAYDTLKNESGYSNEVSTTVTSGTISCDLNNDGQIGAPDLQILVNVILGTFTCAGNCDLNHDGRVDAADLQTLLNVVLGVRSCP